MIHTVASFELPVGERLLIRKNRVEPLSGNNTGKRISIVTGTHGDELEGQYVAFRLQRELRKNPEYLRGYVDIYPALNPLGINSIFRAVPELELDLNRMFPGGENGTPYEWLARQIYDDIGGSDVCVDVHSSNIFLKEMPQVRVSEIMASTLVPLAEHLNMPFIWVHSAATVLESTLAHSLNSTGTPTLVVEMGVGMRINEEYGRQLVSGIFALMSHMGIWAKKESPTTRPIVSSDWSVSYINAQSSGVFLPKTNHMSYVRENESVGIIVDPLTGEIIERLRSPADGLVFTIREYPIVYEGSLLMRILGGEK